MTSVSLRLGESVIQEEEEVIPRTLLEKQAAAYEVIEGYKECITKLGHPEEYFSIRTTPAAWNAFVTRIESVVKEILPATQKPFKAISNEYYPGHTILRERYVCFIDKETEVTLGMVSQVGLVIPEDRDPFDPQKCNWPNGFQKQIDDISKYPIFSLLSLPNKEGKYDVAIASLNPDDPYTFTRNNPLKHAVKESPKQLSCEKQEWTSVFKEIHKECNSMVTKARHSE